MHSRIFQVSMEPIKAEDYIPEFVFYDHWFTREIADYVDEECNREESIRWLNEFRNGYFIGKDEYGEYLVVRSKDDYFFEDYEKFEKAVKEINFKKFVDGVNVYHIESLIEDKFGFYISADGELITFDQFIRTCICNEKYYIGNVLDYHY